MRPSGLTSYCVLVCPLPIGGTFNSAGCPNVNAPFISWTAILRKRLVGAWSVQVTLRNCDTNAPMGSFISIVSFHRGGTLSESTGSLAFQSGQRSEGHGAWKHLRGRTFSQHVIALIRFDSPPNLPGTPTFDPSKPISPGFSAGWQTISQRVRLTGPDSFESSGTTEFFDSNGQSYRTGCSTAVGQRFE
jgi:hypothetical protein